MYSCQHESAFFNFPLSAVFGDDDFFLHSSLLISLKALPTAFRSTFASFLFRHFVLWNLFHICIIVRSSSNVNDIPILFSSFSTFSQFHFRFFLCNMHPVFHEIHTNFLFLAFHCSTCSAVPCTFLFHMFHFSVFTIFSTIATISVTFHAFLRSLSEGAYTPPDTSKSQPTAYCFTQ